MKIGIRDSGFGIRDSGFAGTRRKFAGTRRKESRSDLKTLLYDRLMKLAGLVLLAAAAAMLLPLRTSSVALVRLGGAILTIAIVGIIATLAGAPLAVSYLAWFAAGVGMGIAYPTAYLVIMRGADAAEAGSAVSSEQVAERLALALGGGLGGVCVALALALHASLATGLAGAFGLALLAGLASIALAPRLTMPRPAAVATPPDIPPSTR